MTTSQVIRVQLYNSGLLKKRHGASLRGPPTSKLDASAPRPHLSPSSLLPLPSPPPELLAVRRAVRRAAARPSARPLLSLLSQSLPSPPFSLLQRCGHGRRLIPRRSWADPHGQRLDPRVWTPDLRFLRSASASARLLRSAACRWAYPGFTAGLLLCVAATDGGRGYRGHLCRGAWCP